MVGADLDAYTEPAVLDSLFKTVTSLNTKKLNDILADLDKDADNIDKLVPIVQERMSRGERENAAEERRKAGISRQELTAWIKEQREDKKQRDADRKSKFGVMPITTVASVREATLPVAMGVVLPVALLPGRRQM